MSLSHGEGHSLPDRMLTSKIRILLISIIHIKGTFQYTFYLPEQKIKHSAFKFWNVYGNGFDEKDYCFAKQVYFAS
jgi:hypothetical protein